MAFSSKVSRRESLIGIGSLLSLSGTVLAEEPAKHIATNTYPWSTFAKRAGEEWKPSSDELLADIASTGLSGWEPIVGSAEFFDGLEERLAKHGLEMRSLYVNSALHDPTEAEESIASVLAIANAASQLGTKIIVTNPSPITWGGDEHKTDEQLRFQAKSLDRLGAELNAKGMSLAYHNHDIELKNGAREFRQMLTATDPEKVKFCLDAHWVFRGCGDSEVAVFDTLSLYHERIVELHLRQSTGGIWNEVFSLDGDIDYERLLAFLEEKQIEPHLVLEQAVERGSPETMDVVAAHRKGRKTLM